VLGWLICCNTAAAQLTIDITRGVDRPLPIAIVPFGTTSAVPVNIAAIVSADLQRSGRLEPLPSQAYTDRPTNFDEIDFETWRALGMDYLVVGRVSATGGEYFVKFQLADVLQGSRLIDLSFKVRGDQLRRLAHQISDLVYEKITGERGPFSTRIAYVTASATAGENTYALVVADIDGYNPQVVLRSKEPIMSPVWSPDGESLAYVSFEDRKSQVIVQNIFRGSRRVVSAEPGINGAPAWSPDGQRLALTLSRDGDPEIYIHELSTGVLTRLTSNSAIDTEPAWAPDGRSIVFTSDRGGEPQLYRVGFDGGSPERLTYEGSYNAGASFSPDGQYLAMIHRTDGGEFRIAVMDMRDNQLRLLTDGRLDESPSFAPNGRMIVYATTRGSQGVLAAVSVDGRVHQNLVSRGANVRDPAWSPYVR
jgi:TolB protein